MYEFSILDSQAAPWPEIESCADHVVFKSRAWMDFLVESQGVRPLPIAIRRDGSLIGYFIGARLRKGIRIVASPFEGWCTPFQGLSVLAPISIPERLAVYKELITFCEATPGCDWFQATDWGLAPEDMTGSPLSWLPVLGYRLDLTLDEEVLFARFSSATRRAIRKAQKGGVTVGQPEDPDQFVRDYYDQLLDVFAKQGLKPTYSLARIRALVRHLLPTGNLLLLESRSAEGACIGTGIFCGDNRLAQFWGGASYRASQILRPNEILFWEAIRRLRGRGLREMEFGGLGAYKEKYGPEPCARVQVYSARWKILASLKNTARIVFRFARSWRFRGVGEP